jgi:alpha-tubulin suppressor-like RCC1 family protein
VEGLPKVKAVAAGYNYSLALTESGEVYAWGWNEEGQLGLGDTEDRLTPTKVEGLPKVKAIAAGGAHSLALTESGEVYVWGYNASGQLGLGDTEARLTPTKVEGLPKVKAIAAGGAWPIRYVVEAGHSLALTESGEVYAWGNNAFGQLGLGDTEDRLTPTKVEGLPKVKAVAAGYDHSLALTESGEVYAWGNNASGQLGLGDREVRLTPTKVPGLARVKAIAAGGDSRSIDASLVESYAAGTDMEDEDTDTDNVDTEEQPTGYSLALAESGEVYAWGNNSRGQLGLGDTGTCLVPTQVPGLAKVKAIAAGQLHSLALTESGEVYAWGVNWGGEEDHLTPTKVTALSRRPAY